VGHGGFDIYGKVFIIENLLCRLVIHIHVTDDYEQWTIYTQNIMNLGMFSRYISP